MTDKLKKKLSLAITNLCNALFKLFLVLTIACILGNIMFHHLVPAGSIVGGVIATNIFGVIAKWPSIKEFFEDCGISKEDVKSKSLWIAKVLYILSIVFAALTGFFLVIFIGRLITPSFLLFVKNAKPLALTIVFAILAVIFYVASIKVEDAFYTRKVRYEDDDEDDDKEEEAEEEEKAASKSRLVKEMTEEELISLIRDVIKDEISK